MVLRARLKQTIENIRDSYWFLPALLALAGFLAGLAFVLLDAQLGDEWLGRLEWFYGSRPAGAREMLSTIAGSTITVAGVVFSITLAAVTYASGQFGPRLLSNFMRDRGNQATLGVFIGTYLYCLVVLRTIRDAEETGADTTGSVREAFVPHVAMFGGLALAIASTAVLIYFVHHVTDGIHINNAIARIGRGLIADVRNLRRERAPREPALAPRGRPTVVGATETGYIEAIDVKGLLKLACRHELRLSMLRRPGDFVAQGRPLFEAEPDAAMTDTLRDDCHGCFAFGRQRTAQQDLRFAIDELVEIAARALSPGVNDPFTAIACLDWLGAALTELEQCPAAKQWLSDRNGVARIELRSLTFEDYLGAAFGQLRTYVAADPNALRHALATLAELAKGAQAGHRALVETERDRLAALGERARKEL